MSKSNPRDLVVWLKALDRLLTRGSSPAELDALSGLLASAPDRWQEMPARPRGWRKIPCWARVFSNTHTEPEWIARAVSLCTQAGAGHETTLGGVPAPVFMILTNRLGELNAEAYSDYARSRLKKAVQPDRFPAYQIAWLGRVFAMSHQWKNDSVSPRVVVWEFLEEFPAFRASPLAEKVWAMGLGLTSPDTYAPRVIEFAAMNGLDGNVVLQEESLPAASLSQWPSMDLAPWRPAPAWGWALLRGVFQGSRMLVKEVQESQPKPWDPNALLPDSQERAGDWLLKASLLPNRPASLPGSMIMELDELGFSWGAGAPGNRAIDILKDEGVGPGILGNERWGQLTSQATADLMDRALPPAEESRPSRSRL